MLGQMERGQPLDDGAAKQGQRQFDPPIVADGAHTLDETGGLEPLDELDRAVDLDEEALGEQRDAHRCSAVMRADSEHRLILGGRDPRGLGRFVAEREETAHVEPEVGQAAIVDGVEDAGGLVSPRSERVHRVENRKAKAGVSRRPMTLRRLHIRRNVGEGLLELVAKTLHRGDRCNGDQGSDQAVFDGSRGTRFAQTR